jgi:amino acid transporter
VIPTAFATTGLTGIPSVFLVIAIILAIFAAGYVAMARSLRHAGTFYAFIAAGLGRVTGVAAALVALLAYSYLQVGLYGAFGPNAAAEAAAHLGLHAPWWAFALAAWAVVAVLGLLRVDITGRVLGVLLCAELAVIVAQTVGGLARPAGGHLSFATLSPAALGSAGFATFGVLAVVAVLGFVGFEQAPVLAEEAKNARRTVPAATYTALGMIAVFYAGASWAMAARAGTGHVVAAAAAQGPGLMFGLSGSSLLSQAAQWLFLTSLFAAALAFHNATWRYAFALGRENVLPAALGRTGSNNIPKAASLAQSATGLAVITGYALTHQDPMTRLFFWLGTSGGLGIMILLAATSVAVIVFFSRDSRGETAWRRLIAPGLAAALLAGIEPARQSPPGQGERTPPCSRSRGPKARAASPTATASRSPSYPAARSAYVTANHPTAPCPSSPPASGPHSPQAYATANSTTPARHDHPAQQKPLCALRLPDHVDGLLTDSRSARQCHCSAVICSTIAPGSTPARISSLLPGAPAFASTVLALVPGLR